MIWLVFLSNTTNGTIVAARRQIQANITNEIHKHFDQSKDLDFDGNENVLPCLDDDFC